MEAPIPELWEKMNGKFLLEFDDGVIETNASETIISAHAWSINRDYPHIGLKMKHHIRGHMKEATVFKTSTFADLLSGIKNDIFDGYQFTYEMQDDVWRRMSSVSNDLVNGVEWHRADHQMAASCHDALELLFAPEMLKIDTDNPVNVDTITDPDLIQSIYRMKRDVIAMPKFKRNFLSVILRSSVGKISQTCQALGPRGILENINSHIYKVPISTGYMMGLLKAYDFAIESRTAAMSLNNQNGPLKFTEYLSRRVQFIGMQLQNLHHVDCGSEHYMTFQVQAKSPDKALSDLELLQGMIYKDEESGQLRSIKKSDTFLIGKRLKLRTVLGCQHPDPNGVCSTCFGDSARNVPKNRNIGHFAMVTLTAIISQLVLSTKHETASARASLVSINEAARPYFMEMNDGLAVGFVPDFFKHYTDARLVIKKEEIHGLRDVEEEENVSVLAPQRTSRVRGVVMKLTDKTGNPQTMTFPMVSFHDEGFFSASFLKHLKHKGYSVNTDGDIVVDLNGWDVNRSLIQIVPKQFNTFEYSKGFERLIKASVKEVSFRARELTPENYLMELVDVISQKLTVPMSVLQVVAYTMMCVDVENKDYSLPKPWTKHGIGTLKHIMKGRSVAAGLSHEEQADIMVSPATFRYTNRQDHAMDEMYVPEQMDLQYLKHLSR